MKILTGLFVSFLSFPLSPPPLFAGNDVFFHQRTVTESGSKLAVGRYMYMGTAPRFQGMDLTIYVSKMGLTNRVQAWVRPDLVDNYAQTLAHRFLKIARALDSGKIKILPPTSMEALAATKKTLQEKAWITVAGEYSQHILDNQGLDIFSQDLDGAKLNENILTALGRVYFNNPSLSMTDSKDLAAKIEQNPANFKDVSQNLFSHHFGEVFTSDSSKGNSYLGYLTFVYPIAANAAGPFSDPSEGVYSLGINGSMEARWWSDKWDDEFGGFPFLMFTSAGVAFHGPITNNSALDAWYLRRDHASHGCMRMSPSDILELRALLPSDITKGKSSVTVVVMNWPDVTDWNKDGSFELVDIGYYGQLAGVPTGAKTVADMVKAWEPANRQKTFYHDHYSRYDGLLTSKNAYDSQSNTIKGLPQYLVTGKDLTTNGFWGSLPIKVFPIHKQRILQYREEGAPLVGFDDRAGSYPPEFFNAK